MDAGAAAFVVLLQQRRPREGLAARRARVFFGVGMRLEMRPEVRLVGERAVAALALERLLAGVRAEVALQQPRPGEGLAAQVALARLGVRADVHLQRPHRVVRLGAELAAERLLHLAGGGRGAVELVVLGEAGVGRVRLAAVGALVALSLERAARVLLRRFVHGAGRLRDRRGRRHAVHVLGQRGAGRRRRHRAARRSQRVQRAVAVRRRHAAVVLVDDVVLAAHVVRHVAVLRRVRRLRLHHILVRVVVRVRRVAGDARGGGRRRRRQRLDLAVDVRVRRRRHGRLAGVRPVRLLRLCGAHQLERRRLLRVVERVGRVGRVAGQQVVQRLLLDARVVRLVLDFVRPEALLVVHCDILERRGADLAHQRRLLLLDHSSYAQVHWLVLLRLGRRGRRRDKQHRPLFQRATVVVLNFTL